MLDHVKELGPQETFSDLWRNNYLQVTSKVTCQTIHRLNLEPYSCAMLKRRLKARKAGGDGEECEVLDRAMEYTRVVGAELVDMMTLVHEKVQALELQVPAQHTFGGDGLQDFIQDHQDCLECLEGQLGNLTTITNQTVERLLIYNESYRQNLCRVEEVNVGLLRRVVALEHGWGNPILVLDSSEPVPVPPPAGLGLGSVLVLINDVDDDWNQAITEDQVEAVGRRVIGEEGREWGIIGEEYEDGEDVGDVLCRIEARDWEIPRYPPVPGYNDPYIPDVQ